MAKSTKPTDTIDGGGSGIINIIDGGDGSESGSDIISNYGGDSGAIDARTSDSDSGIGNAEPLDGTEGLDTKPVGKSGRKSTEGDNGRSNRASKSASKSQKGLDVKGNTTKLIAGHVCMAHAMLDNTLSTPGVFAIEQDDAEQLVEASQNLFALYKIKPNPKVSAALTLLVVAGLIYQPRVKNYLAIRRSRKVVQAPRDMRPGSTTVQSVDPTQPAVPVMQFH